jgi:hypothetical protein
MLGVRLRVKGSVDSEADDIEAESIEAENIQALPEEEARAVGPSTKHDTSDRFQAQASAYTGSESGTSGPRHESSFALESAVQASSPERWAMHRCRKGMHGS